MSDKFIIGAGMAGLITACKFPTATIIESGKRVEQHKALLRFRDKSVSDLTGIPFKEVTVNKAIFYKGHLHDRCNIQMANKYAMKVIGTFAGRSIWNLETVKRYIAPFDFYDQLVDRHENRIRWNEGFSSAYIGMPDTDFISTAPLPNIMLACGMEPELFDFKKQQIRVDRYSLPEGSDVYQTIYFPNPEWSVFRASISGNILIVESMLSNPAYDFAYSHSKDEELRGVLTAFGIEAPTSAFAKHENVDFIETVDQKYGKIVELPREKREAILYDLTREFRIFSVGRFATWRNILLDDVVNDIEVVKRLLQASTYGRKMLWMAGR